MRFVIYRDKAKEYRWRLRADNNEIIAHGEGYKQKSSVKHVIYLIKTYSPKAKIVDLAKPRP